MQRILKWNLILAVFGMAATPAGALSELAKVNGKSITDKDMQTALSGVNEGQRATLLKDLETRRQILSNLIDQEVLYQQATREKLDQDAEYKETLEAFRKQYLAQRVLRKSLSNQLTPAAVKAYFGRHKDRFSTDKARVQHILVEDELKARKVMEAAKKPDADFQKLAETQSRDHNAKNNRGEVGWITRDSPFTIEFKEAVFNAPVGEVTGPVKTAFGYHVIKVIDKVVGKALNFEEVELRVRSELESELVQVFVGKLKSQAKVDVNEAALKKL